VPTLPPIDPYDDPEFLRFEKRRGLGTRSYGFEEAQETLGCGATVLHQLTRSGQLPAHRIGERKLGYGGRDLAMVLFRALGKPHDLPDIKPPAPPPAKPKPDPAPRGRGRPRAVVRRIGDAK
jgi:hypothetical protein